MHLRCLTVWLGCVLLACAAWGAELKLTVLDASSGKPIAHARVVMRANGGYPAGGGWATGEDGQCLIRTKSGDTYVSLLVRHEGHVTTTVTWDSHSRAAVEIPPAQVVKLAPSKPISGHVLDPDGQPVLDAKVYLEYWPDTNDVKEQPAIAPRLPDEMVMTDEEGLWVYSGAPADALDKLSIRVEHPDFISNKGLPAQKPQALLDGTVSIKLDRGTDVTGQVVTSDGKPVAGATISTEQFSYVSNDYGIKVTTDPQGHFALPHMATGSLPITVIAHGFSPELITANVKKGLEPLAIKLSPGRPARGRVVDPSGKPIAGVYLHMDTWRSLSSIPWNAATSRDGRFEMADAPIDSFTLQVSKEGYQYKRATVRPADPETIIRLSPIVRVKGVVSDAATGKPLQRFNVIPGVALWTYRPPFFEFERPREFKNADGHYELELQHSSDAVAGYVRIEADGYTPFVSPALKESGTVDAKLLPGQDFTGTVHGPDGAAIADATVVCVMPGAQVNISDAREVQRGDCPKTKTDAAGRFRFGPQVGPFDLLILADAGYTLTPVAAGKTDLQIALSPWSAVEGVYKPTGKASARPLFASVNSGHDWHDHAAPLYLWMYHAAAADEQGLYRIDRLPHFDGNVVCLRIDGRLSEMDESRSLPVSLSPGKTLHLDITPDKAASLTGRVAPAAGQEALPGARASIFLHLASDTPAAQRATTIAQAMKNLAPEYSAHLAPDGSFTVPAIPPGRYEYTVGLYAGDEYATVSGSCEIAQEKIGATVDLGTLSYLRASAFAPGRPLPDLLGTTLDEKPIRAADLKGKYIVLAIWNSYFGSDDELAAMEKLGDAFAANDKVVLVSLNSDVSNCGMTGLPIRPATPKSQTWLAGYLSTRDSVLHMLRPSGKGILIAGPDGKILATGVDPAEAADRLKELLKP